MSYVRHNKTPKSNSISVFLLLVILGFAISRLVVLRFGNGFQVEPLILAPIVFDSPAAQKLPHNSLSGALTIPTILVNAPVKDAHQKQAVAIPEAAHQALEAHLIIPRINVDAVIKEMGLTSDGAMAVPNNRVDVGWFSLQTRPGEIGSAVIGGHNHWDDEAAVFEHLDQLEKGDVLFVVDAKGVSTFFVVRDMRTYDATDTNTGIFESESGVHLNLITCSGAWDPSTKSPAKRLVIFTDVIQADTEYKYTHSLSEL